MQKSSEATMDPYHQVEPLNLEIIVRESLIVMNLHSSNEWNHTPPMYGITFLQ